MVSTFDPKRCIVTVAGIPLKGFADGESISVEFDEDEYEKVTGNDGEVCRVAQNQQGGKITLSFMYSSGSNAIIDGLAKLDKLTRLNPVPIVIRDILGGTGAFARSCWVVKDPGFTVGRSPSDKEWVFDCAEISVTHGPSIPS